MLTDISATYNRPSNDRPKVVPILGAPRGGTSMVTATLIKLGVNMGNHFVNGYQLEDAPFKEQQVTKRMMEEVRLKNKQYDIWGFKYPNSIYYIKDLEHRLKNPHYVTIFRNPFNRAISSAKRDPGQSLDMQLVDVGLAHTKRISEFLKRTDKPSLLLSFENVLQNPETLVDNLVNFLHLTPSKQQINDAIGIIDSDKGYKVIEDATRESTRENSE